MNNIRLSVRDIDIALAKKQINRRNLAQIMGISESNLSTALKKTTVRPATAGKIAAALGVNVEEIIVKGE